MHPVSPVILCSERLYAREFTREDLDNVCSYACSPKGYEFLPFCPESREDAGLFLESRLASQIEQPRRVYDLALCLKETDEFIGTMSLTLDEEFKQAELGYVLLEGFRGKGLASEAAEAFLRFGFMGLDLHRIYSRCDDANAPSYRLMERIGMRREAHFIKNEYRAVNGRKSWRSSYHYAILIKEYLMRLPDGSYSATGIE